MKDSIKEVNDKVADAIKNAFIDHSSDWNVIKSRHLDGVKEHLIYLESIGSIEKFDHDQIGIIDEESIDDKIVFNDYTSNVMRNYILNKS